MENANSPKTRVAVLAPKVYEDSKIPVLHLGNFRDRGALACLNKVL